MAQNMAREMPSTILCPVGGGDAAHFSENGVRHMPVGPLPLELLSNALTHLRGESRRGPHEHDRDVSDLLYRQAAHIIRQVEDGVGTLGAPPLVVFYDVEGGVICPEPPSMHRRVPILLSWPRLPMASYDGIFEFIRGWLASHRQHLAIPCYFDPRDPVELANYKLGDPYPKLNAAFLPLWKRVQDAAPTVRLAIINPNNGPWTDPTYTSLLEPEVQKCQKQGITVVGYVYTKWANTVIDDKVSPHAFDRTVEKLKADIDQYYLVYPSLNGIFFDECYMPPGNADSEALTYYRELNAYVKGTVATRVKRELITVLNPGRITDQFKDYVPDLAALGAGDDKNNYADIVATFDGPEDRYTNLAKYQQPAWVLDREAGRFCHLIYATKETDSIQTVALSQKRHAGYVCVSSLGTSDEDYGPNVPDKDPWSSLLSEPYWTDEVAAVRKGFVLP